MNSMTGFGRGIVSTDTLQCTIEIKSVNSRYCDLNIKLPRSFNVIEDQLRNAIRNSIYRGKVECIVIVKEIGDKEKKISINSAFCQQIKHFLVEQKFFKSTEEVPLSAVMSVSNEWLKVEDVEMDETEMIQVTQGALAEALVALNKMRAVEGQNIKTDLEHRFEALDIIVDEINSHKEEAVYKYEARLKQRIDDLVNKTGIEVSSDRFLQEVAIMTDKTDITEEIVRFRSHMVQLKNTINEEGPIGRKLDFLLQELNREVNTMGSKGSDLAITDRVVALKSSLEKIREQIQNIE